MQHYGHQGFAALVKIAQLVELLADARPVAAKDLIGVEIEKVMAIHQ